jgi:hypothetical protein
MTAPLDVLPADSGRLPDEPLDAVPFTDDLPPVPPPILDALPVPPRRTVWSVVCGFFAGLASAWEWCFGAASLVVGLAFLAAIPILGFLSLGYLLEAGARIARNTASRDETVRARYRWRITRFFASGCLALADGLIGFRTAARLGGIGLGVLLMVLPVQIVSSLYASAEIIDPGSVTARVWQVLLTWVAVGLGLHIALACLHGGKLRYFLWPIGNLIWIVRQLFRGNGYATARDAVWDFVVSLRLPYYFWLGVRGFAGALAWLVIPITLMAIGRKVPLLGIIGGIYFGAILLVLPFLQMHFAVENRFRASFELGAVLTRFGRAPWAFAFAQFITLLFSLPLYLFKIEVIPQEVGVLPSVFIVLMCLVFVVFIYPTRMLAGWAYARSERRQTQRNAFFAVTAFLWMIPTTAIYVIFVFLTQYTSWKGFASLYEQHAFLLPVPFIGW